MRNLDEFCFQEFYPVHHKLMVRSSCACHFWMVNVSSSWKYPPQISKSRCQDNVKVSWQIHVQSQNVKAIDEWLWILFKCLYDYFGQVFAHWDECFSEISVDQFHDTGLIFLYRSMVWNGLTLSTCSPAESWFWQCKFLFFKSTKKSVKKLQVELDEVKSKVRYLSLSHSSHICDSSKSFESKVCY